MAKRQNNNDWLTILVAAAEIGYFFNRANNNKLDADYFNNLLLRFGLYGLLDTSNYNSRTVRQLTTGLNNALTPNTFNEISTEKKITPKQRRSFFTLIDNKSKVVDLLANKDNQTEANEFKSVVKEINSQPKFVINKEQNQKLDIISKELERKDSLKFKLDEIYIKDYRVLKDFRIKFENSISIIIGENGSGKSTLIEFIANIIARLFLVERKKDFELKAYDLGAFELNYSFYNNSETRRITISNDGEDFEPKYKSINYPDRIVVSYSGITDRLKTMIQDNFEKPFVEVIKKDGSIYSISPTQFYLPKNRFYYSDSKYMSIIYCALTFSEKEEAKMLLDKIRVEVSGCDIKFTFGETYKKLNGKLKGNIAPLFFDTLSVNAIDSSLTGIIRLQDMFHEFKKDISSQEVFDILYYLKLNDLIDDIQISWKTESGNFDLEHISEGQKQELMTLGLSLVFDTPGTLFLLDEPDTYLHPKWQREFISSLTKATENGGCAIVTSHSPSIVSDVRKEQLFILNKGRLVETSFNNYGKEVDEILIDYFGLDSTRSKEVQYRIDYLREMIANDKYETNEFKNKFDELAKLIGSDSKELPLIKLDIKRREYAKNK